MKHLTRMTLCASLVLVAACDDEGYPTAPADTGGDGASLDGDTAPDLSETGYENCFNGRDDNGDLLIDCADPECRQLALCAEEYVCPDGNLFGAVGFPVIAASTFAAGNDLVGSCGGQGGVDLGLTWTAPETGRYFIDTLWGSYDTVLYVLDGGCGGEEIACNDDSELPRALQSQVEVDVVAGQTLLIVVDGYEVVGAESGGDFVINITPAEPESERGFCTDRRDNDGDGVADCMDDECVQLDICAPLDGVQAVEVGASHGCALRSGALACWGAGSNGELGDGEARGSTRPVAAGAAETFIDLGVGDAFTCGLTADGKVLCWGSGAFNVLLQGWGVGSTDPVEIPLGVPATAIAVGSRHACALLNERVACWGNGDTGQLGNAEHRTPEEAPVWVEGLDEVSTISAGGGHSCAITAPGELFCWGLNNGGQLGASDDDWSVPRPVLVRDIAPVTDVALGASHSCAITTRGELLCWGQNWSGQIGNGTTQGQVRRPTPVLLDAEVSAVDAGRSHTCAISDGVAWCWGDNGMSQLGVGDSLPRPQPVQTGPNEPLTAISAGDEHTCAVDAEGMVWCWGANRLGQLGDGTREIRREAARVLGMLER